MSVKPVQTSSIEINRNKINSHRDNQVSFGNAGNPIITLMDAIDRGGFAASFIMQDFLGMAGPRVLTGMYRNHDKTGQLNWDFAKKEGVREILSGPSAFLIPAAMMSVIKKISGSANNVPIDFIKGFGDSFSEYAKSNADVLADYNNTKLGFYKDTFKNILATSTNNCLKGEELDTVADDFAKKLIETEKAPKKSFWKHLLGKKVDGSAQDMQNELLNEFVNLKKKSLGSSGDKIIAEYSNADKKIATSFKSIIGHMRDFSEDVVKNISKKSLNSEMSNIDDVVKNMCKSRSGTRFLSNMSMWLAVVGFYTIIPKLYNKVTKGRDPGLDGLNVQGETKKSDTNALKDNKISSSDKKEPSFTGLQKSMSNLGKSIVNNSGLKKISDKFEFDGATMSMPGMLSLLFGFCLPPRLINAQSNTDRKEILMRDMTSFIAILFGAKAINRVFSDAFAKISGLALNIKPSDHNDNIFKKIWHYVYPTGGVQVLDSDRIVANYSNVNSFKDGINDLFKFVEKNGGNVGKLLSIDNDIKEAATEILGSAPDKNMKLGKIINDFDKAKGTKAYEKIISILSDSGNNIVKRAKTYNSAFGFVSTILLVPALMIWISKHCEKMTKKHIAMQNQSSMPVNDMSTSMAVNNKPTMAGFLSKR